MSNKTAMAAFSRRFLKVIGSSVAATSSGLCLYLWQTNDASDPTSITQRFTEWKSKFVAHAAFMPNFKSIKPWDYNWDNRDPKVATSPGKWGSRNVSTGAGKDAGDNSLYDVLGKSNGPTGGQGFGQSKFTRHLLFIRHGQYVFASDDEECRLTETGRSQANLTGQRLRELNLPYKRLVYSTMTRAIETAEEILKHLPGVKAEPSDLIQEGAPYPPEPPLPTYNPSPEDITEDNARIEAGFRRYVHRASAEESGDSYEIYVCHANVIRYFLCRALQFPPEAWLRFSLDHGSVTWVTIRPNGRVAVRCVGSSGHMPPEKVTVQ